MNAGGAEGYSRPPPTFLTGGGGLAPPPSPPGSYAYDIKCQKSEVLAFRGFLSL